MLGLCWDGTGYGPDKTVWGGEVLLGDATDFERVASLAPFQLPGGDACSREGWRVALALLHEAYGDELPPVDGVTGEQRRVVLRMLEQGVNGVRAAGFFGADWTVDSSQSAWRD